jgi:hypothetical protein
VSGLIKLGGSHAIHVFLHSSNVPSVVAICLYISSVLLIGRTGCVIKVLDSLYAQGIMITFKRLVVEGKQGHLLTPQLQNRFSFFQGAICLLIWMAREWQPFHNVLNITTDSQKLASSLLLIVVVILVEPGSALKLATWL